MNTKKALRQPAPKEVTAALGLRAGTTIGAVFEKMVLSHQQPAAPVDWSKEEEQALFTKLIGTPEEQAEERRLRELAYRLVSRTATREELFTLLHAGIICEPKTKEILVPEPRLLQ